MTVRDASYQLLESAINRYLSLDPEISSQLGALHGQVIGIELAGIGLQFFFIPDQKGTLQLLSQYDGEADCMIIGAPLSLLGNQLSGSNDSVFSGDIKVVGKSALAQEFTRIIRAVDIDWEEQLSRITGDVIAHQAGNGIKQTREWFKRNINSSGLNVQEYLQEEIRLTPGKLELDNFFEDVDTLRDGVERLEARINRLISSQSPQKEDNA